MALKPCLVCGALSQGPRCPTHASELEAARNARRAPNRVGRYGAAHRAAREAWAPDVAAGLVRCRRGRACKRWPATLIQPNEEWHLGHPDEECSAPLAPEHAVCNTSAAGRLSH